MSFLCIFLKTLLEDLIQQNKRITKKNNLGPRKEVILHRSRERIPQTMHVLIPHHCTLTLLVIFVKY